MENLLLPMNSIIEWWMSPSSADIAMDMSIGIVCGAGLFFLLIPFLKMCPVSPPPESERAIPKDVKRGQSNSRKKTAAGKDYRNNRKNEWETQNAPRPMESPARHPLLDSSPQPFWNSKGILHQLTLSQLFFNFRVLEDLIQHKCIQILWGISSVLSESVVATAWVSRKPSSGQHKTVRFCDACCSGQDLPMAKGPPQLLQGQPLPHKLVTPSLVGVTGVQELENLPSSTPNQTLSLFQSRACETACPPAEIGTQASLLTEKHPWKHRCNWKDITSSNVQKHQAGISQPTDNLPRGTTPSKAWSASILPKHCQVLQHHKETQNGDKTTNVGKKQRTHVRFLPSLELTQLQGHCPENSEHYCKSGPQLPQPAPLFILNPKNYQWSKMMGTVPMGVPLRKVIEKSDIHNTIKKVTDIEAKDVPCTSSSTPGKGLEPRNPEVKPDKLSSVNTAKDLSFLDPKTQMKLESNITQLSVKQRRNLPCVSKAEYYSKASMILEKLHHQDPGGTKVETVSTAWLRNPLFEHSPPEVRATQRAPLPAASHRHSKSHPDPQQRYLTVQPRAFCFQANSQQSRILQRTGKGCLLPNTSPGTARYPPWKMSDNEASGQPHCSATIVGPEENVPPLVAKQTNTLKVKDPPQSWRVSLGSSEIPNGQAINMEFESLGANRSPGHLQTPILQYSEDLVLKPKVYSKINLRTSKPVNHHPDGPNTVHPAMISLPSQHSLPSFQTRCQNPETSQGLGDVFMRSNQSIETQEFIVYNDKITTKNDNAFHPLEERQSVLKSGGISQGERLGRARPSILISTQVKDTAKSESHSSVYNQAKEDPAKSTLKHIKRNAAQYGNLSPKYKGQEDSLKNESPTPATEQTQDIIEKGSFIYNTAVKLQSFINILVQNLANNVDASKPQQCKVESLTFQLGGSSEDLYDPNHSRLASNMSYDQAEGCIHSSRYREIEDKQQPGIDHTAFDPHQNIKKEMGFGCLISPVMYREAGGQRQSTQGASDPDEIRTKSGKKFCPHRSPTMHSHSFRYTGTGDKLQSCVNSQRACDQHPYSGNKMGFDPIFTPKGNNYPQRYWGVGGKQQQSGFADQRACDPGQIIISSRRRNCYPQRNPKSHHHSFRYKEIRDKQHPGIVQRTCNPHPSTKKGRSCVII